MVNKQIKAGAATGSGKCPLKKRYRGGKTSKGKSKHLSSDQQNTNRQTSTLRSRFATDTIASSTDWEQFLLT